MPNFIAHALLANAATLSIHWIYDQAYIAQLLKEKNIFYQKQDPNDFAKAKPSYYAYPLAEAGEVTSQGMFLIWLYQAWKNNPNLTQADYRDVIFKHIKPGGDYTGYIETYGHKLIINTLNENMKLNLPSIAIDDDHLIGFIPYLVAKQLGYSAKQALPLTQLFSDKSEYFDAFTMFDHIIDHLKSKPLKTLIEEAILLGPKRYQFQLKKAISMEDTLSFVKEFAGTACAINQSVPVIIHLLYRSTSFEDMLKRNALISGAISERGMLLGAIIGELYPPKVDYTITLHKKLVSILLGNQN
jgi:hypothetical protein